MKMVKNLVFIMIYFLNIMSVYAEPSPFGLKIKETVIEEVKNKYKFADAGINKYSNGAMLDLEPTQLEFEGLKNVRLIFNVDGKLLAVTTLVAGSRYTDLLNMLSNKYKLVSKKDAFVGDKGAEFKDDNTKIILVSPHMDFNLQLDYIHEDLYKCYIDQSTQEKQEKEKQEKDKI